MSANSPENISQAGAAAASASPRREGVAAAGRRAEPLNRAEHSDHPRTDDSDTSADSKTFRARMAEWFDQYAATGIGVSIFVHASVLLALSIVMADYRQQNAIGTMLSLGGGGGGGAIGADGELEDILDTRIASVESEQSFVTMPPFDSDELVRPNISIPSVVEPGSGGGSGGGVGAGTGGGVGDGKDGFRFSMPGDGRAVTKGSFAAWTEPADPKPSEPYKIVIQIKLPKHVKQYPLTDLSGLVEGTDQYRQTIPQKVVGFLPVNDSHTQYVVDVPGAEALVKDVITVRSRLLNERQELEIVF